MPKFHISVSGEPANCTASKKPCPRGGEDQHFESEEKAYEAISKSFGGSTPTPIKSSKKATRIADAEAKYSCPVTPYELKLDAGVEAALEDLREVGNPLIVGGAVRDSFEGHDNKDIDIEVHETDVESIINLLRKKGYSVDEVGKEFGVLKASKKGVVTDLDVAVPRRENRTGAGHRNFEVELDKTMTVTQAAERRDFTFNSAYVDPARGVLIDPANGRSDFDNKIMRHVSEKFSEDPLRVLRGFQFAGRFEMIYDPKTAELCKSLRNEYSSLSVERVREEWSKFFTKSTRPSMGVEALQQSGWDDTIPGLQTSLADAKDDLNNLPKIPKDDREVVGATLIARTIHKNLYDLLDATLGDNDSRRKAKLLLGANPKALAGSSYNRKMFALNASGKKASFKLYESYAIATNDPNALKAVELAKADGVFEKPEPLLVNGNEIMKLSDKKAGPWVGKIIESVREKQYKGELKSKEEALEFAKSIA